MSEAPKYCKDCPVGAYADCYLGVVTGWHQEIGIAPGPQCPFVRLDASAEMHANQLAAIMTATVQNTDESKKERIGPDHPYYTVAYSDVCNAVDREITLRDRNALLEEAYGGCQIHTDHMRTVITEKNAEIERLRAIDDFQGMQNEIAEWARATFPNQHVAGILSHLKRELDELLYEPQDLEEWADCFMLLMDGLAVEGFNMARLFHALKRKLAKNKTRIWGTMQPDGTIEHDRQALGGES